MANLVPVIEPQISQVLFSSTAVTTSKAYRTTRHMLQQIFVRDKVEISVISSMNLISRNSLL